MESSTVELPDGEPRGGAADPEVLRSIALGYRLSQALYVFAELRIADILAPGSAPLADIAGRAGAHPQSLLRLLRVGRAMGLVDELAGDTFRLTVRGRHLRTDIDGSSWPRVRAVGDQWQWSSWGRLLDTVTTGRSAFEEEHGFNSFDYFERNPGAGDAMMNRVTEEAGLRGAAVADAVDFSTVRCIADVGGGRGAILAEILTRHRHLRGILFDLPYAVADAAELLDEYGVADRCTIVAGDFRVDLPADADVHLLSAVVHSWSDDDAIALLRRCLARAGRVLLLDEVIEPDAATMAALLKDLQLMVFSGGRHRSLAEYRQLFELAGGEVRRLVPVGKQELLLDACTRSSGA